MTDTPVSLEMIYASRRDTEVVYIRVCTALQGSYYHRYLYVHNGPNVQIFAVIEPVGALNRDLGLRSLKDSVLLNNLTRMLET